jgi:CheY-like chemotaxis protein
LVWKEVENIGWLASLSQSVNWPDQSRICSKERLMTAPTILIAEDDDNDVLLLKNLLRECRVTNPVQVLYDGEEVISYIKGEGVYADRQKYPLPFLLLLDLRMPKKGGIEVMTWLKTLEPKLNITVIVLTAFKDLPQMNLAYLMGARSFITKPLNKEEFRATICTIKGVQIEGEDESQAWEGFKPGGG